MTVSNKRHPITSKPQVQIIKDNLHTLINNVDPSLRVKGRLIRDCPAYWDLIDELSLFMKKEAREHAAADNIDVLVGTLVSSLLQLLTNTLPGPVLQAMVPVFHSAMIQHLDVCLSVKVASEAGQLGSVEDLIASQKLRN